MHTDCVVLCLFYKITSCLGQLNPFVMMILALIFKLPTVFSCHQIAFLFLLAKCNSTKTYWAVARKYYLRWNTTQVQINFRIRPQNLISTGKHETASPRRSQRGSNTPDEDNSAARWLCFCLTGAAACWGQNRAQPPLAKWTARRWLLRSDGFFTRVWSDDGGSLTEEKKLYDNEDFYFCMYLYTCLLSAFDFLKKAVANEFHLHWNIRIK